MSLICSIFTLGQPRRPKIIPKTTATTSSVKTLTTSKENKVKDTKFLSVKQIEEKKETSSMVSKKKTTKNVENPTTVFEREGKDQSGSWHF